MIVNVMFFSQKLREVATKYLIYHIAYVKFYTHFINCDAKYKMIVNDSKMIVKSCENIYYKKQLKTIFCKCIKHINDLQRIYL
jgi:hypothetical protein